MLFKKTKKTFGLDIGNHTIKLTSLERISGNISLNSFIIEKNKSNNFESLKAQIKNFNITKESVNLSVGGPNVLIRYLTFPKLTNTELKNSLYFEAEKHIPFPISEVYLDSFILKDLADKKMLVLVVAAKKALIDEKIKLIQELGLNLGVIDVDSVCLINAFNFFNREINKEPFALLNIGSQVSNLVIIDNGNPEFTRDLLFGGNIFTQAISDKLNLSIEQAEELKCSTKEGMEKVNPAIEQTMQNFCSEIRASFDYYESQAHFSIKKIFISGGGANLKGIEGILQNYLGIQVLFWPNIDNIELKEGVDREKFNSNKNSLLISLGLALRGL
ncbi:MAG: type IV pilus assembly protein PilM [Candidatus Omnitrophota bacterium]